MQTTLSREQALLEAERCLYCYDAPCEKACPSAVPVSDFIYSIKTGNLKGAMEIIVEANPLIDICGILCPAFCQDVCTRKQIDSTVRIRALHRYIMENTDMEENLEIPEATKEKVAIVGGGPAGLACARELRMMGYRPYIFEKKKIGGIPAQEVSSARFSEGRADREIGFIKKHFAIDVINKDVDSIDELANGYAAVFISTGLADEQDLGIPREALEGVYKAREILRDIKDGRTSKAGKRVGVIGGGNVAIEVASALKAENPDRDVEVIYRRGMKEIKAFPDEIEEANELGVTFQFMAIPKEIRGTDKVEGIVVTRAHLGEPDESGRRQPEPVPDSDFFIPLDTVVIAVGQKADKVFPGIQRKENGLISVDENMMTSVKGVFAGGDIVRGASTIVECASDGKKAAEKIAKYIEGSVGNV
ncbi:MAG: FAD-dependent oxidoreductase [Thermoanaerobacteraceae bacterium]|nr:FAD-dependent oxidoreductase [Thermoanaerobacteraceae bacterium]